MASDWHKLRVWNGSVETGFEELCCQLASEESYPAASRFTRKGTPDAGVECYWTLADGKEHAWQAKFFLASPTAGQWKQIDESVKTALKSHPHLSRYTICLPIDRPDARKQKRDSFQSKWDTHVATWKTWAKKRRMTVDFEYWGDHELTSRLNHEKNRGRHWFWFSTDQFTLDWFQKNLNVAIENAGERYTPELHVELPISKYFDSLGQTPEFFNKLHLMYVALRRSAGYFIKDSIAEEAKQAAANAKDACQKLYNLFDQLLMPQHDSLVAKDLSQNP